MAHGGKRQGAGRKVGALTAKTREIAASLTADGITPLEYMLQMLRDNNAKPEDRFEAAKAAAPYVHPRLAAVEHSGDKDNPVHTKTTVEHRIVDGSDSRANHQDERPEEARPAH